MTAFGVSAMPRARDFFTLGRDWFATVSHFLVFRLARVTEVASAAGKTRRSTRDPLGSRFLIWAHTCSTRVAHRPSRNPGWWWAARDTVRRCATLLEPVREDRASG
ncbi:hypothetical protein GCM10023336_13110 [Streptomyces similanensis]|uniref:Uncharacterized protein n=1 Tax=Streptomyces similanensis TaxID=1274988 RepID=A0ABP9K0W2_9ACTN